MECGKEGRNERIAKNLGFGAALDAISVKSAR